MAAILGYGHWGRIEKDLGIDVCSGGTDEEPQVRRCRIINTADGVGISGGWPQLGAKYNCGP